MALRIYHPKCLEVLKYEPVLLCKCMCTRVREQACLTSWLSWFCNACLIITVDVVSYMRIHVFYILLLYILYCSMFLRCTALMLCTINSNITVVLFFFLQGGVWILIMTFMVRNQ